MYKYFYGLNSQLFSGSTDVALDFVNTIKLLLKSTHHYTDLPWVTSLWSEPQDGLQLLWIYVQYYKKVYYIPFCTIRTTLCKSLKSSSFHSLSLLSLSVYAPKRLRDEDPFCVVMDFEACESAIEAFESVTQHTQYLSNQIFIIQAVASKKTYSKIHPQSL